MSYLCLILAIVAEVAGTTCLKLSDGFTRPLPAAATAIAYVISFYLMSLTLRSIPTGVAYAIWSGVGIVLITVIAWTFLGQKLGHGALWGMALIIAGVVVLNLFSSPLRA
jgi:small multidrug resistance pump